MPCSSTILPRTRREQRPRKDLYQYHFKLQDCVQSLTLAHSLVGREPWLGRALEVKSKFLKEFRRRRSVWYSVHLNIVAFIALSMIINIYFPGASAASEG